MYTNLDGIFLDLPTNIKNKSTGEKLITSVLIMRLNFINLKTSNQYAQK